MHRRRAGVYQKSEMSKLIDDYFREGDYIASQMVAWCTPTPELIKRIKRYEQRNKAWRRLRTKGLNEKPK